MQSRDLCCCQGTGSSNQATKLGANLILLSSSDKHNTPPCLPSQKATIAIPDNKSPLHPRSIGITEQGLGPGEEKRETPREGEEESLTGDLSRGHSQEVPRGRRRRSTALNHRSTTARIWHLDAHRCAPRRQQEQHQRGGAARPQSQRGDTRGTMGCTSAHGGDLASSKKSPGSISSARVAEERRADAEP